MKWLKRLLKGIAYLLLILLLAAVGFREWCVWRLPGMRKEVNDAWRDYAGVALDDVPKKFPAVETNETALNLEKAAAKLGICLAPKKTDEKCPRNAPTDEAVKEFEALSVKDAKGEKHSRLKEYADQQMEKPDPTVAPPPVELEKYLAAHREDLTAIIAILNGPEPPKWAFKPSQTDVSPPDHLLAHLSVFRLLIAEGMSSISRHDVSATDVILKGLERLNASLLEIPQTVGALIGVAENRMLSALIRKSPRPAPGIVALGDRSDWIRAYRNAQLYFAWQFTTPEAAARVAMEYDEPDARRGLYEKAIQSKLFRRFSLPWARLSMLQMNLATIHDGRYRDAADRCSPNERMDVPGVFYREDHWYTPAWIRGYVGYTHHPELSWWNSIGKIIYAISEPNIGGIWRKIHRMDLESELTRKVMALRDARREGAFPATITGIESSVCKNEKWIYTVNPDGSASLAFSVKPDWGTMKGAKVPLQWTEPAPGK